MPNPEPSTDLRIHLRDGVVEVDGDTMRFGGVPIAQARPEVLAVFMAQAAQGTTEDDLLDAVLEVAPAEAASALHLLQVVERAGGARYEIAVPGGAVHIEPERAPLIALSSVTEEFGDLAVLPSSWIEPEGSDWSLRDARAAFSATLIGDALALLGRLPGDADAPALTWLARAGLLATGPIELSYWDAHDLRFHWRTRKGRHQRGIGASFPRRPQLPVRPTIEPPAGLDRSVGPFTGPYVHADAHTGTESGYAALLQERRSTREPHGELTEAALGAFLNAHALTQLIAMDEAAGIEYPQSRRRYPGGGATYEIDLNVTLQEPLGAIDPGVWWWNPEDRRLHLRSNDLDLVRRLFDDARVSTGGAGEPRALITYSLRIGRNSWKYDGMAYRLALMNVGVLYHHAYLVGADLGIGICGLGNGDALLFDRGLGLDLEQETSIAELMITGMVGHG